MVKYTKEFQMLFPASWSYWSNWRQRDSDDFDLRETIASFKIKYQQEVPAFRE